MSTMEQLVRRQKTGQDLRSVVGVMKSLSAVAIRQYDDGAAAVQSYREIIDSGLQAALRQAALRPGGNTVPEGSVAYVVVGSDRGLCGHFNELVANVAHRQLKEASEQGDTLRLLTIGASGTSRLESYGWKPDFAMALPGALDGVGEAVEKLLLWIDKQGRDHGLGGVRVIFNQRTEDKLAVTQAQTILPVTDAYLEALRNKPWPSRSLPDFTVDADELFSRLIREHLFLTLAAALMESLASEHASRLAAMQRAERHIDEHLASLSAEIRDERQNAITQQLLDIIGSYNVMKARAAEEEAGQV